MKVLIVGGGGREHALAWKLKRDDPSLEIIAAPGNPGIAKLGRCVPLRADDVSALAAFAKTERVGLTIVGPEAPLDKGIVDAFRGAGLAVFGPTQSAARIETSKHFAKDLMLDAGVPTAAARTFGDPSAAKAHARKLGTPVVIKASGLAAGKGVIVAETMDEADAAIVSMLEGNLFGDAGHAVLVEEFMTGEEISVFALTDGVSILPMIAAQDHKRIGEGDTGPNTGGMGAYAPVAIATAAIADQTIERVFLPTLHALRQARSAFTGLLYAGLMLTPTGPRVVEFNCRFGDPETETLLPLLESSLFEPIRAIASGASISGAAPLVWRPGAAVTTVVAASGYPDAVRSGDAIALPDDPTDVITFHAGTKRDGNGQLITSGGRVFAVTALGPDIATAQQRSAAQAAAIGFEGRQFRRDIGWRELARRAGAS